MDITTDDVQALLPRQLLPDELDRVQKLIEQAQGKVAGAFARAGRDLDSAFFQSWFPAAYRDVVVDMVSAAVLVGINAGVRTVSSATGPQSDQVTYANVGAVNFGGVRLTDEHRRELGLPVTAGPLSHFPCPPRWPEV